MVPQILQALPGPAGYQEAADGQGGAEDLALGLTVAFLYRKKG